VEAVVTKLQEALDLWNVAAAECGWPIVRRLTADRERKLYALLKNGLDDWREALAKAKASDFLCGRTARSERHSGWRFSFDAMVRDSFFTKVLEGNYDNREDAAPTFKSPETLLWEARLRSYRPGGMWLGIWGPRPEDSGCQAPPTVVDEWKQKALN
jgi:hypothetical protein